MPVLPKITVVTPNFNGVNTLEETLRSVIDQDYPNLEYIIIDGGSTDGSLELIESYRPYFTKVIVGKDKSMYDAIAKAFDTATGEILAWLNSDDLYEPNALLRVGEYFQRHPHTDVIYMNDTVMKDGWRVPNRPQKHTCAHHLRHGHIIYQEGCFFKRSAYEAVGGLNRNLRLAGDYDLWLRLAAHYRLALLPGNASCFRLRKGQLSGDWGAYLQEMQDSCGGFIDCLTWKQKLVFWLGGTVIKVKNKLLKWTQRPTWHLENENADWVPIQHPPEPSLRQNRCPVCDALPDRLLFSSPDTRFGDRHLYRLYECGACRTAYTFPFPDTDTLQHLYESTYSAAAIVDNINPPEGFYSPFRRPSVITRQRWRTLGQTFRAIHKLCHTHDDDIVPLAEPKTAAILELGCFEGRILAHYRRQGYQNLTGVELNAIAADQARAQGFTVYTGDIQTLPDQLKGQRFDAIVLNQTLEHFADPATVLRAIAQHLVPKGRIYISVPNRHSFWLNRYYGPTWAHWHVPFHAVALHPGSLKILAQQTGFKVRWMNSSTPVSWMYLSDQLAVRGLGGVVSHNIVQRDPAVWLGAQGAHIFSWLFLDRLLRGDCLYACFQKLD